MKNRKKGRIKKLYTSIHYRMVSISLSVFIFIAVMVAALVLELYNNQENYIHMYERNQQIFVEQLADFISYMYEEGKCDTDVVDYLTKEVDASGSRFFVYTRENEVLFAKNDITTKCLGSLKKKSAFYESLEEQNVTIQKVSFSAGEDFYELAVVSDIYTVRADGELTKHQYYILMAVAVMSLVLVSLLVTLVGSWNRTQRKLEGTEKELDIRNEKMEIISQETGTLTGDKTDMLTKEEVTGVIKSHGAEFYNIYTIKMLLEKSEDKKLKPLQIIFLDVIMDSRYFTKDEIFNAMERIQEILRPVEVMGEVRKGEFVILAYRTSYAEAGKRIKEITDICEQIEKEEGIRIQLRLVEEDEKPAIERFESGTGGKQ
ncbi:MAG: hypothetical protein ACI4A3_04010 [Lachnospiraceae bacterium]